MNEINERIKAEIEKIPIVDTHEHTMPEAARNECAVDFSYLKDYPCWFHMASLSFEIIEEELRREIIKIIKEN